MTTIECLAWSALVVSGTAAVVWLLAAAAKQLGIALGYAPAWAVLTSIPFLTAASLLPTLPTRKAADSPAASAAAPLDFTLPSFDASVRPDGERRLLSEEVEIVPGTGRSARSAGELAGYWGW